jgi:dienelactone hydrolase
MRRTMVCFFVITLAVTALAKQPPAPSDVDITAADGAKLKATYYPAAKPGPAVLLLHMCNSTRKGWAPLAPQLSAAGIHALALDYRGYGESGGDRFPNDPQKQQELVTSKWPGDVDAAFDFLLSQPGVDKTRIGVAGGSCGVNQAVQFTRHHPAQVKSLVLLAGPTTVEGMRFLSSHAWIPIFAAAAADDQFDSDAPRNMRWFAEFTGNARNKFAGFADGKHGTEIFPVHPELPREIVAWFRDTLVKSPAKPSASFPARKTPFSEFWAAVSQPDGVANAVQMFHEARRRDPKADLFPEAVVNLLGYDRLQAGKSGDAVELFKLNVEAYPASANVYDSLADGYVAAGQNPLALQASKKALELLPASKYNDAFKQAVRQSSEQRIEKLTAK